MKRSSLLRYTVAGALSLLLAATVFLASDALASGDPLRITKQLSDAFLLPAVLCLAACAIHAISLTGAFDMLQYSIRKFFTLFRRGMEDPKLPKDFYLFAKQRSGRKFRLRYLLHVGIVSFAVSVLFTVWNTILY